MHWIWSALLGGVGVAITAGPLGCFLVWRRMAYFSDTLAHSALLGVALGVSLNINITFGVTLTGALIALFLVSLRRKPQLQMDTLLGIFAHSTLALGIITLALTERGQVDLMGLLLGDILAINEHQLLLIYVGGALILTALWRLWKPLLNLTVDESLAQVEGVKIYWVHLAFVLLVAVLVALAMKVVGVLLISALLIIPAAAANPLSRTPEEMAFLASLAGVLSVLLGIGGSFWSDIPAGPAIVVAAFVLFLLSLLIPKRH